MKLALVRIGRGVLVLGLVAVSIVTGTGLVGLFYFFFLAPFGLTPDHIPLVLLLLWFLHGLGASTETEPSEKDGLRSE